MQGCQHCVSKKFGNFVKCLTHALLQAIGLPRHRRSQLGGGLFPSLSEVTEIFCKIESKFLNSKVLAGDLVVDVQKSPCFKHI